MKVIDSHTEGEPTRVIIEGGPDLGSGSMAQRLEVFQQHFDHLRTAVILEPRGSDVLVGAMLCPPTDERCAAGVIFFNNAGYLGMCGHGIMGVAATMKHLGLIDTGMVCFETPVGIVKVAVLDDSTYQVENVPSYLYQSNVSIQVDDHGMVCGDVAWGGNWFFLTQGLDIKLDQQNVDDLSSFAAAIKQTLSSQGITGHDGAEIDHIELFGDPACSDAHSKNFVLCPGNAYDRSPCGTGTSAKVACLAAHGQLQPGEKWIQDSIINSRFEATYRINDENQVVPSISGRAYVTGSSILFMQNNDPFKYGITQ